MHAVSCFVGHSRSSRPLGAFRVSRLQRQSDSERQHLSDNAPQRPRRESIQRRNDHSADLVLKHLLFVGEAPLTDGVRGTSGFAEQFAQRGPRDQHGRSLRHFNLKTRIFQYPCSYLIYSAAFDGLPAELQESVYRKLHDVLTGRDQPPTYKHLSPESSGLRAKPVLRTYGSVPVSSPVGPYPRPERPLVMLRSTRSLSPRSPSASPGRSTRRRSHRRAIARARCRRTNRRGACTSGSCLMPSRGMRRG